MSRFQPLLALGLITCLLLGAGETVKGDPPSKAPDPKLTPMQQEKLKILLQHASEAAKFELEGKLAEARAAAEKCLAIEREVWGEFDREVAESLTWLARLSLLAEDFPAARDYATQAMAIRKKVFGESHWKTTDARVALANVEVVANLSKDQRDQLKQANQLLKEVGRLRGRGESSKAVEPAAKARDLLRAVLGEKHPRYAESLTHLGSVYFEQGSYTKAEPLFTEVIARCKDNLGERHPDTAHCINNLASLYFEQGLLRKATPLFIEAVGITKEALGEKHPACVTSLCNLGCVYRDQGLFLKAENLYQEALLISKDQQSVNSLECADCLSYLATLYFYQGRYEKAEPLAMQVLEIRKKVLGEKHPSYASSLSNLAAMYHKQGLYSKAEPLYREAMLIHKDLQGKQSLNYALSLNNLGVLYDAQHEFAKAEPLLAEALLIRKNVLGEAHHSTAFSMQSLGECYHRQHAYAKAEPLYQQALAIRKNIFGNKHPEYAATLNTLGVLYNKQKQHAKAEPFLTEALAIRKEVVGVKHPDYSANLNDIGCLYFAQGQTAKAAPYFKDALGIIEEHLERIAAIQSESNQLSSIATSRLYLDNLLANENSNPADTYGIVFRWRGAVTARQTFARAARGTDPDSQQSLTELREVSRRLCNLINNPPKPKPGVDLAKLQKDLEDQRETIEKTLASQSKDFSRYRESRALKVADIQKLLPADAALVDFLVVYDHLVTAFVITPTAVVRVNLKPTRNDIAEMVDDFVSELSLKQTRPVQHEAGSTDLCAAIWEPLVPHLKDVNLVLICPDGPLCRVPFAALRGSDPKKYLIEERAIAVIPVPRLLPELLVDRPTAPPSLLVVGDVDFTGDPGAGKQADVFAVASPTRAGGPLAWKPLPATAAETKAIVDLFHKTTPGATTTTLTREAATEAAIRHAAAQSRYLHFATHGFFDSARSNVKPAAKNESLSGLQVRPPSSNPGLMCGLVCAGANKPTPDDDGVLTALEIADLDLSRVELAVLSACETGLGEVAGGDGVLGLQRAFQLAGARTTVTSLWKVPDQSTGALMARFYENRVGKEMPTLIALQKAQLWILNEGVKSGVLKEEPQKDRRTPPLYWAAFVLAGDWR